MVQPNSTTPKIIRNWNRLRAQSLVEFAIALPFLLMLVFGIIEFGRFLQAWLALENGARFGVRYAITGNYNPDYCQAAGEALGLGSDDILDGSYDCQVPQSVTNWEDETNALMDWARLPSIRDAALAGATGIAWDDASDVSGDYQAYLANAYATSDLSQTDRGDPALPGYFNVTVCSNRVEPVEGSSNQYKVFQFDPNPLYYTPNDPDKLNDYQFPDYCEQAIGSVDGNVFTQTGIEHYVDDAGGPGDRVRVVLTYRHPLITPFLSAQWQTLRITAQREGLVEKFRTSRVTGLTGAIGQAAFWTLSPPPPSDTPLPSNTPEPYYCDGAGTVLHQVWENIGGTSISDLTSDPNYPYNPDITDYLPSFEGPTNWADMYGTRMQAYLCAPYDGDYHFYIASDDNGSLLMSADQNVSGASQIAYVPDWTDSEQWGKEASQESGVVHLQRGHLYYIEAFSKEGGGGDNLAIGWAGPGITDSLDSTPVVIDGRYLVPLSPEPTPTATPPATYCTGAGSVLRQWWLNISGGAVSDLTSNPRYPNDPDGNNYPTTFEAPINWTYRSGRRNVNYDNYGTRMRAYLCAPYDGDYVFYVSSDDNGALYMNTAGQSASQKVLIGSVGGYTGSEEWDKYSSQKSAVIHLQAGQLYYMEALMKENTGDDNLAVGWAGDTITGSIDSEPVVIDGRYLVPLTPEATSTPTITLTPSNTPTKTPVTPSKTPTPVTPSFTPSKTPIPSHTFTPSKTPTKTPVTPSKTPTPVTPTKTHTPVTPSKTPTPVTPSKNSYTRDTHQYQVADTGDAFQDANPGDTHQDTNDIAAHRYPHTQAHLPILC